MLTAHFPLQASVPADGTKADYIHHAVSRGFAYLSLCPSNEKGTLVNNYCHYLQSIFLFTEAPPLQFLFYFIQVESCIYPEVTYSM